MKILYVGNFLGATRNKYDGPNEQTVLIMQELGYVVKKVGTAENIIIRYLQIIWALLNARVNEVRLITIDVFSTNAYYFATTSAFLARLFGIKYVLVLHGGNLPERFKRSPVSSKRLIIHANKIISPSGYLASEAKRFFNKEVLVIPNLLELSDSLQVDRERKNILVWVRSISSIYNPEMAIEVLRLLTNENSNYKLLMIGPGQKDRLAKIKELVDQYGLSSNVEILGGYP